MNKITRKLISKKYYKITIDQIGVICKVSKFVGMGMKIKFQLISIKSPFIQLMSRWKTIWIMLKMGLSIIKKFSQNKIAHFIQIKKCRQSKIWN